MTDVGGLLKSMRHSPRFNGRSNLAHNVGRVLSTSGWRAMAKWKPGESPNPGGRPKIVLDDGRTLVQVAREHTLSAVETLVTLLDAESEAVRATAATALLDRGWGRPRQDLGIELKSDEAAASMLEQARRRAMGVSVPAPASSH
ncbi:hypothetical protein [Novosphingobium sp. 9U]|uniref:hypothetical protein n=1 Tax=Novosphingobium sp. 9U TaxID=2653158 RepID=UPI0012F26D21|nr:hypothetical protein [Novosphingobium sp. 9U]VWX52969.1 hypothetical protein NOVOSPHI9U_420212 [Novosphingobium sp. 9U]